MTTLIFLDTETLGLDLNDPIWEIGIIRREPDGAETEHHFMLPAEDGMPLEVPTGFPEPFASDFQRRYQEDEPALTDVPDVKVLLRYLFRDRPHVVGAVPNFDTERIAHQFGVTGWHYHLIDVENLAVGWLAALGRRVSLPWDSDVLSEAVGIDPSKFQRHTAMDDARWAKAIYDQITSTQAIRDALGGAK